MLPAIKVFLEDIKSIVYHFEVFLHVVSRVFTGSPIRMPNTGKPPIASLDGIPGRADWQPENLIRLMQLVHWSGPPSARKRLVVRP